MLEHRHRILCPKGYQYIKKHTQIHHTQHSHITHNTLAHTHTRAVTAAVAALDDITLPGGAAEGASAAYTRKRTQFKWQLRLKRCYAITLKQYSLCLPSFPKRIRSRSVLENRHSVAPQEKGLIQRYFCMLLSFQCKQLNGCLSCVCIRMCVCVRQSQCVSIQLQLYISFSCYKQFFLGFSLLNLLFVLFFLF